MQSQIPERDTAQNQQENTAPWPYLRQLTLQCAAAFGVLSLSWPYFGIRNQALPWPETAFIIGAVALLFANITRQPWRWRLMHAFFAPLAWLVASLAIDPGWFLLAFIIMLLVYRGAITGQIPLYLSNAATTNAIAEIAAESPATRFIDLGAGIGSVLRAVSKAQPKAQVTGVENAPATWLVGYLLTIGRANNCNWRWGDFWGVNLEGYDVVYAFLSPAPMPELWNKAQREMRSGTLLICNSFAVPGVTPSKVVEINDSRQTSLYCYRL